MIKPKPSVSKQGISTLYPTARGKLVLIFFAALIVFGSYNMVSSYAQQDNTDKDLWKPKTIQEFIIVQLLTQVGPITGGIVGIGIDYLRRRGIQISGEAEEYLVNFTSSLVARESKWIYEQLRDNSKYRDSLSQGRLPLELGKEAKQRVFSHLNKMIDSKEFTGHARTILRDNLSEIIESAVAKNNKELTDRSRKLIREMAPLAVDSILLFAKDKDEIKNEKEKIINQAIESIKKSFDFEEIMFDRNFAEMFVKSTLQEKIEKTT